MRTGVLEPHIISGNRGWIPDRSDWELGTLDRVTAAEEMEMKEISWFISSSLRSTEGSGLSLLIGYDSNFWVYSF